MKTSNKYLSIYILILIISAITGIVYVLLEKPTRIVQNIFIYYFWGVVTLTIYLLVIVPKVKKGKLKVKSLTIVAIVATIILSGILFFLI
jgi:hypothetical protein